MPDRDTAPPPVKHPRCLRNGPQRPFRLFDRPEPVDVVAETPQSPPRLFTWRRVHADRVARAAGPERIEPEWWVDMPAGHDEAVRDYYSIEDSGGPALLALPRRPLRRCGTGTAGPPRWYVHGLYG